MYTDFTQMPVWKHAMDIAVKVFEISKSLPKKEDYALTSQIRRAAESISSNIFEGFGRGGDQEKIIFYRFSRGSANETKKHLIYGTFVKYFEEQQSSAIISKIKDLVHELNKIIKTIENKGK
ncbi:four helix bundle protein [Kaistella sp.]|uniref:four helix bundle protein n=1 Tax=Kaistella sp. TaxID=2782235 RepID=UPI002F9325D0